MHLLPQEVYLALLFGFHLLLDFSVFYLVCRDFVGFSFAVLLPDASKYVLLLLNLLGLLAPEIVIQHLVEVRVALKQLFYQVLAAVLKARAPARFLCGRRVHLCTVLLAP